MSSIFDVFLFLQPVYVENTRTQNTLCYIIEVHMHTNVPKTNKVQKYSFQKAILMTDSTY